MVFLSRLVFCEYFFPFSLQENNRLASPTSARIPASKLGHPDRFLEEFDYDRRLKKRKVKLVAATEEAFAHLGRVSQERIKGISDESDLIFSRLETGPKPDKFRILRLLNLLRKSQNILDTN